MFEPMQAAVPGGTRHPPDAAACMHLVPVTPDKIGAGYASTVLLQHRQALLPYPLKHRTSRNLNSPLRKP